MLKKFLLLILLISSSSASATKTEIPNTYIGKVDLLKDLVKYLTVTVASDAAIDEIKVFYVKVWGLATVQKGKPKGVPSPSDFNATKYRDMDD